MNADGGGIGESGDGGFEQGCCFGGATLADEEESEGGRDVGDAIAAGAQGLTESSFGLRCVAVAFVGLPLGQLYGALRGGGFFQCGERFGEAVEGVERAAVIVAGIGQVGSKAAGLGEGGLGGCVGLERSMCYAERLPDAGVGGLVFRRAFEQWNGSRCVAVFEQRHGLIVKCGGESEQVQGKHFFANITWRNMVGVLLAAGIGLWTAMAQAPFEDRSGTSGIGVVLRHHPTAEKHQIETMPGGVAAFDFDNDGKVDLFFTNGAPQPGLTKRVPEDCSRLYRNLGGWRFEDVTVRAGLCGEGYSMGAATADYDNDGFADLFVAGVNRNFLYRNRGDGTFEDVTEKAGVANRGQWAVAAGWFDYDNDGRLDLLVVNYVKWDPAKEPFCGDAKAGYRSYCHPKFYEGLPNVLYRNQGDGMFRDVSVASGIGKHVGKGMGVAFADLSGRGRMDVVVANDTTPNFLFRNRGDGVFEETGFTAGVAMNDDGRALSSMGVDFRAMAGVLPDLFVTALSNETFPLYRNRDGASFTDATYASQIGRATMAYSGWGAGIYDFDNDGFKDIFAACGDVQTNTEVYSSRKSKQANLLLTAKADGTFAAREVARPAWHRGAAFADFDGDGRVDVVVTRLGETPVLLRNTMGGGRHWIGFALRGTKSNRDGIGARVRVVTDGGEQWNHVTTSVGYASSSETVVRFGLGNVGTVKEAEILWPSGARTKVAGPAVDRVHRVTE